MAQYTQRTQPMHSHVTWLQENIKQNIIPVNDCITICQLHLNCENGTIPSRPVPPPLVPLPPPVVPIPPPPPEQKKRPTTKQPTKSYPQRPSKNTKCTEIHINKIDLELLAPKPNKLLNEPSTSKCDASNKRIQQQTDFEREIDEIEREVNDIAHSVSADVRKKRRVARSVSADVMKKRKVTQKRCAAELPNKVAPEILLISDDDDDDVDYRTVTVDLEEVDNDHTRSSIGDEVDQSSDDDAVLIHDSSTTGTNISKNVKSKYEPLVTEEPESDDSSEDEIMLPAADVEATNDPLKINLDFVKEECDEADGTLDFEDYGLELEYIKEENLDNTIDIGETVIQTITTQNNQLYNIFSTLVEKNFITVEDKNHLSTLVFDADCILNDIYIFNDNIKELAQELYMCSEAAYNFMAVFIPCLPPADHIKETFITSGGTPGFSKEALQCLRMKIASNNLCSLTIHDIQLQSDGRDNKVAFIISVAVLNASWKLPICYYICRGLMNSRKREKLIKFAISIVQDYGVDPKAICYVTILQNIEMADSLARNQGTKQLFLSWAGKKIYLIPDPAYIFDEFRICGCVDQKQMYISLRHIELLVKYLFKIRPGKMTNRLMGKSITYSLEFCADDFLSSGIANVNGTVFFLKQINQFLDIMTSHLGETSWKESARSKKHIKWVTTFLSDFQNYLLNITPKYKSKAFWLNKTARGQLKFDIRSLMNVLIMAVYGARALILEQKESGRVIELNMKQLTMNSATFLTNFYNVHDNGEMRGKTEREFITRYKQNLKFMKPRTSKKGNILPIEKISILDITSPIQRINVTTYLLNSNYVIKTVKFVNETKDDLFKILKIDRRCEFTNLAKIYIAGYVVYNLVRRLRCDVCISALVRSNLRPKHDPYNTELVIKKTDQDSSSRLCVKLMDPSPEVVRICKATDDVFRRGMAQSDLDILQRFTCIPLLTLQVKEHMIGKNYFEHLDFHRHDTDTIYSNHVVELAKAVAEVYLLTRLKYWSR